MGIIGIKVWVYKGEILPESKTVAEGLGGAEVPADKAEG
jgi:ribosomal protein S3